MAQLILSSIAKRYGAVTAVDRVNLHVRDGEFVTLLGPSGCGKTTTLRMIAGFIQPDDGEITVGDRVIASPGNRINVPPEARKMSMVFQNYALWPHMSVIENTMFGLRTRHVPARQAREKAMEALRMVRLEAMAQRYPHQLSGGQQQRISLARAIACEPAVLLMDEPLSNLDAKFREAMRIEIKELHRKLRMTSIYVTHDQAEAIVMSDRICVMWQGKILQVASPVDIYTKPASVEVAGFIGQANLLQGRVVYYQSDGCDVDTEWGRLRMNPARALKVGQDVMIAARPECIRLSRNGLAGAQNAMHGRISTRVYLGNFQEYWVDLKGKMVRVQASVEDDLQEGESVTVNFDPQSTTVIES